MNAPMLSANGIEHLRRTSMEYRRVVEFLDQCGELTLDNYRRAWRMAGANLAEERVRAMWEAGVLASASAPYGDYLRSNMRATLLQAIERFEEIAALAGRPSGAEPRTPPAYDLKRADGSVTHALTARDVRALAEAGRIGPSDLLARSGTDAWRRAGEARGLLQAPSEGSEVCARLRAFSKRPLWIACAFGLGVAVTALAGAALRSNRTGAVQPPATSASFAHRDEAGAETPAAPEPPPAPPPARPLDPVIEASPRGAAPVLSGFEVRSASCRPVELHFSVRIRAGSARISLAEKAGLWICVGRPTTVDMRSFLAEQLGSLRPAREEGGAVRMLCSSNGPGFVAWPGWLERSREDPDEWRGVIDLGQDAEDGVVALTSALGDRAEYSARELPVALLLWDDRYQLSNELTALVDLERARAVDSKP